MKPTFSIIIPVFNNLDGLKKTVKSIQQQTFTSFEVLIIDGGSTKNTQEFLMSLKPPFYFTSKKDFGIYDAMNKGLNMAKGNWILFLGSGDYLNDEFVLQNVFSNLRDSFQLIYGNIKYDLYQKSSYFVKKNQGVFRSNFGKKLWLKNSLHHQSVFYHQSLFKNFRYNLEYKILADYDFNLQLLKNKINTKYLDLVIANCDSQGVSKRYHWQLYQEEIKIKTLHAPIVVAPFFIMLGVLKYLLKSVLRL